VASAHYRHPTVAFLARDYPAIRWLTGGETLVLPAEGHALFLLPRSASADQAWLRSFLPANKLVDAVEGPDGQDAVHVYRIGRDADLAPAHPLTANLGQVARVQGYDIVDTEGSPGEVQVAVWWRVLARPVQGDLGPVARLTDAWGFFWGEHSPFHYPGEQWTPGETIVDLLSIPVGVGAPPGDYRVRFSLYSAQVGAALPVLDEAGAYAGQWVDLPVRLAGRTIASDPIEAGVLLAGLDVQTQLEADAGDLMLYGISLGNTSARQGERLLPTLFWWAARGDVPNYEIVLTLADRTVYAGGPVHDTYPFSAWAAGEVVVDRYDARLPRDMAPGEHTLALHLLAAGEGTGPAIAVELGTVDVEAIERTFEVPAMEETLGVDLGGRVELLGYDLAEPTAGESLALTLYWRALAEMETDYTVFVHLLAPDGSMAGQQDAYPVAGTYPTSLWLPGEVVVDRYEIPVRADTPAGVHRLEVGMYVAESGERLGSGRDPRGAVPLRTVVVHQP
jgi:hypothetical protein